MQPPSHPLGMTHFLGFMAKILANLEKKMAEIL
jgi:hypothetical protein